MPRFAIWGDVCKLHKKRGPPKKVARAFYVKMQTMNRRRAGSHRRMHAAIPPGQTVTAALQTACRTQRTPGLSRLRTYHSF